MKTLVLALFAVLSISTIAQAQHGRDLPPGSIPGRDQFPGRCSPGDHSPQCDPFGDNDPWRDGRGGRNRGSASCAPEVLNGNVQATERTLNEVIATRQFATANEFKTTVKSIAKLKSADTKVSRYFDLIGVDANDSNAVADFVGAREIKSSWIRSLQRSTGLNDTQADIVAKRLQTALRGDLQ